MINQKELLSDREKAGARYAAAVIELRSAYADLAAIERLLERSHARVQSFGHPPDVVPLRHPTFAPNVNGSFADDIAAALARRDI